MRAAQGCRKEEEKKVLHRHVIIFTGASGWLGQPGARTRVVIRNRGQLGAITTES